MESFLMLCFGLQVAAMALMGILIVADLVQDHRDSDEESID
jgi:hypothetical protein